MKISLIVLLAVFCLHNVWGQSSVPTQIRAQWTMDRLTDVNGLGNSDLLYGIPMQPGTVVGNVYADKKWNKTTILLNESDNLLEGYWLKYNLQEQTVEVKTSTGVKIIDGARIRSMVWIDSLTKETHYFISSTPYTYQGTKLTGLLEVLVDGTTPLFKYYRISIIKPTYNVAMGSGSKDIKILINETYFGKKGDELIQIKSGKDLSLIPEITNEVDNHIKANKLSPKKEPDLIRIFEFMNKGSR
ncbi:MAG TPA: hypothetical protein PLM56_08595 [Cyclobacteriaceae bacterium]|jgi:hypothetical protein|nr:hypothetical protein [Cytophagales bacterium]HMR57118.1 hypothetical protein [Cyclobacteriaceae bacterium]HRE66731.1 hypothetical protein [Cyclobacteriaceae bacterium]HRF33545.1 hypothetical protein [Cyclobacteriaceae bacterium]